MTWDDIGQRGGVKGKTLRAKVRGGSQKLCELFQLFSSFLRGASRPKSPRDTAIAANLFMLEAELLVKPKVTARSARSRMLTFPRPNKSCSTIPVGPGQMASYRRGASKESRNSGQFPVLYSPHVDWATENDRSTILWSS